MLLEYCVFAALAWAAQVLAAEQSTDFLVPKAGKSASHDVKGLGASMIVGGTSTSILMRPFMAHIGIQNGKTYSPQCGGTILDKRHILSAAHCFTNSKLSYRVRVGSTKWASGGQLVDVTNIFIHPEYNKAASYDYDIAVLRLSKDLVFGQGVKAVAMVPVSRSVAANTPITLIGWGYTDALHWNPLPAGLREVQLETIDQGECEDDYSSFEITLTDRMFCGMSVEKDSCQGDSGGPVYNVKTKQQMGVISWGMGCAQLASPGVFANLANPSIRSFIAQSLRK